MKPFILFICLLPLVTIAQDEPLGYSRILLFDSLSKDQIYDKTLIWCSKQFVESKNAINERIKESGIITGKANYMSQYKMPGKKDSVAGSLYNKYYFDWLVEIKDGRLRFSASNIEVEPVTLGGATKFAVFTKGEAPVKVMFQARSRTQMEWDMSKQYFISNLDKLVNSLYIDVSKKAKEW